MKIFSLPVLLLLAFFPISNAYGYNAEGFQKFVSHIKVIARNEGVKETTLNEAFKNVTFNHKVVDLDKKQPERKAGPVWQAYKTRAVTNERIKKAKVKLRENAAILEHLEKRFGVEKEILVALWAVETNLGGYMGDFDIIRSLASLSYEGRRQEFFQKELLNALKILDQGHFSKNQLKGSWAGAFGQVQFMPSTFLNHAYDIDNDGKKDIIYNNADALASAANYLNKIGWINGLGWGKKVILPNRFNMRYIASQMPSYKWKQMGLHYADGSWINNQPHNLTLIDPDGKEGKLREVYLVTDNFNKLKEWNRSNYFATSVGLIADALKNGD